MQYAHYNKTCFIYNIKLQFLRQTKENLVDLKTTKPTHNTLIKIARVES